jgi:glucokinase
MYSPAMLLAGDVGGTKTLLGVFERGDTRPVSIELRAFTTLDYSSIIAMIEDFLRGHDWRIDGACFGVAGPVLAGRAELTNVPWVVDAQEVAGHFRLSHVDLLNDLQAMAYSVPVLQLNELMLLQPGMALHGANIGLIAAGTGLGEALLHNVNGEFIPSPSEGGHADFSARTPREIELLQDLTSRYGRAEVEHVISGRGLVNVHRFVHRDRPCRAIEPATDPREIPARLTQAALEHRCAACEEGLELFVDAYGAETGNLALRGVTAAGVFIGGGIAPKIMPALQNGRFMKAFTAKAPMDDWLERVPVAVILNAHAALLGAAVFAAKR